MWQIRVLDSVKRDLRGIPKEDKKRIQDALKTLAQLFPSKRLDVKKVRTTKGRRVFRLRVGKYRVFFYPLWDRNVLVVVRIAHRSVAYRSI